MPDWRYIYLNKRRYLLGKGVSSRDFLAHQFCGTYHVEIRQLATFSARLSALAVVKSRLVSAGCNIAAPSVVPSIAFDS